MIAVFTEGNSPLGTKRTNYGFKGGKMEGLTPGMTYFQLMKPGTPPEELEGHALYVTPDEAISAGEKEARNRGAEVHIFRVRDGEVESQPWRVIEPPAAK